LTLQIEDTYTIIALPGLYGDFHIFYYDIIREIKPPKTNWWWVDV